MIGALVDNDGDGTADCDDTDCSDAPACAQPEVWLVYAMPIADGLSDSLYAVSTRAPARPVVLSGFDRRQRIFAASTFGWQADTLFVARATPENSAALRIRRDGLLNMVEDAFRSLAVNREGKELWTSRLDGNSPGGVVEAYSGDTPGGAPLYRFRGMPGHLLEPVVLSEDPTTVWSTRLVEPPDVVAGIDAVYELVVLDPETGEITPVPAAGNAAAPVVRRATGEVYVYDPAGVARVGTAPDGAWTVDPTAGGPGAYPVGVDLWAEHVEREIRVRTSDGVVIATIPIPEDALGVRTLTATIAPDEGSLSDFIFE